MIVDCDTCEVRHVRCDDCVMTVLLRRPGAYDVDPAEQQALAALAEGGLVPRLQLVRKGVPRAS